MNDNDWAKCIEYEVEGVRPRSRPMTTWSEVVEKDCQARRPCKADAVDHGKVEKVINDAV